MFTTVVAVVAAVLGAASVILHLVAPRTEATWDDKVEAIVDEVLQYLGQVTPEGKPVEDTSLQVK